MQLINFLNVRQPELPQSLHTASYAVHQTINRCRNIANYDKHDHHTHKSTDYNSGQNAAVQLISQTKNRFLCNKATQYPVFIFIRYLAAIQIKPRNNRIYVLSPYGGIFYTEQLLIFSRFYIILHSISSNSVKQ